MATTSQPGNKVKGIVLFARHGDRTAFYQDPTTYTASDTTITPLGEVQEFSLGSLIRSTYLNSRGAKFIQGIDTQHANQSAIKVRADAGDEGGVIFDSSIAFLQGLYPANRNSETIKLANGTVVTSPLGGYNYIPIESVEANEDVSLEGHASCTNWSNRVNQIYQSPAFLARAQQAQAFLTAVKPFLDDRSVTAINAYNIFDFVNVQSIHVESFFRKLPQTLLLQARDLANFHEWIIYTDPNRGGIGNIDAYTMIPSILSGLSRVASDSDPLKIHYQAISYKPFISIFNLTAADPINHPVTSDANSFGGLVDYASAVVLEVYSDNSIKMRFKNGTHDFVDIPLNSSLSTVGGFTAALAPLGINSTRDWCNACGNHVDRGCADIFGGGTSNLLATDANTPIPSTVTVTVKSQRIDPLAAGFIGAFSSLAFSVLVIGALTLFGVIGLKKGKKQNKTFVVQPENMAKADY